MRYSSCYVTMRDGVRIAIDLYLPAGLTSAARLPAILHQTRYYRSLQLRWPLRMLLGGKPLQHIAADKRRRRRFVASGYAWVDVDVRGSGASFGARVCEWSSDEIRDGAEIVDWIVRQPWCNGTVAALGNSYDGTSAELLLVNQHPAVRVIAPCFSLFDVYTDIAFPGGIHAAWFTDTWGRYNEALDRNALHEVVGWWAKLPVTGMQPVQEDRDRSLRDGAIAAHRGNYDVHQIAGSLTFRDDVSASDPYRGQPDARLEPIGTPIESGSINLISPHNYWRDVQASGAAIYSYSGWFDGGYAHAAIKRFLTVSTPGSHLILGPWNHTGGWRVDPLRGLSRPDFDHDGELLRFIDHLRQGGRYGHRLRAAGALLHHGREPLEVGRHLAAARHHAELLPVRRPTAAPGRTRLRQRCRRIRGGSDGRNGRALTLALASGHRWTRLLPGPQGPGCQAADLYLRTARPSPGGDRSCGGHAVYHVDVERRHLLRLSGRRRSARPCRLHHRGPATRHPPPAQRRAAAVPPGGPLPNVRERGRVAPSPGRDCPADIRPAADVVSVPTGAPHPHRHRRRGRKPLRHPSRLRTDRARLP